MKIEDTVREKYGEVAKSSLSNSDAGVRAVAEAFGYSASELDSIPADANMGLSCGNPTAMASLRQGETVVDLGSGGGLDVFLAAKKIGPSGKAIGIDMTPEMIERATKNAEKSGYDNVEFHLSKIDKLPLADNSVDCIISNCVINLAPDKRAVFREMFRVLRPGGRVAVSDIALKKQLPPELAKDVMAYVGCVAGAILIDDYIQCLKQAGFDSVHVIDSKSDLNAYGQVEGQSACCSPPMEKKSLPLSVKDSSSCCSAAISSSESCCTPTKGSAVVHEGLTAVLSRYNVNDYAASVKVYAVKPK
ncbi:MAG TPA: arsenite methyltransferase [Tepidisphaeraceae bacterium]|nr:arsenite methyltransferase [Tepidisphaeraceae bacterium]